MNAYLLFYVDFVDTSRKMRDLVARIILRDALPLSRCTLTWTAGLYLATRVPLMSELPEPVLLKGGEFKARHQISLADAIIAAYAFVHHAILVHKDPEFEALTMVNQMKLPYKRNEKTNEGRGCRLLN